MAKTKKFDPVLGEVEGESSQDKLFERQARAVPHLQPFRTLVLNADYQPLEYKPLKTVPWTKVFFWLSKGWGRERKGDEPIVHVVAEYEDKFVRSSNSTFQLPAIVAHSRMVPMPTRPSFSRGNVFLRDNNRCQYTGVQYPDSELTLDHVIPASQGGKTNWENIVTCHYSINFAKADKSVKQAGLTLIRQPYIPTAWELREKGKNYPSPFLHPSWGDYVFWNEQSAVA